MDALSPFSRRQFIQAGVCWGFALAVPPTALALTTPGDGLEEGPVEIPVGPLKMPGYHARPKGKGPFPVILVVHEIFGVHAYIQDVCRRFAKEGFHAVAPYLYHREGDVTQLTSIDDIRSKVVSKVTLTHVLADLDGTVAWLKNDARNDLKRLSITGFCWGGGITWLYAAHNPTLKAAVAWYGRLVGQNSPQQSQFPTDVASRLNTPVLGLYGEKDTGIPLDTIEKMRAGLALGKSGSEIHVYAGAQHGFHADYRPMYDPAAAADGWKRTLAWLKKHGAR